MKVFLSRVENKLYNTIRKIEESISSNDETIFNISCLIISTVTLQNFADKDICIRQDNENQGFQTMLSRVDDFFSLSYGYDKNCLQWIYSFHFLSISLFVLSLMMITCQMEHFLHHLFPNTTISFTFRQIVMYILLSKYSSMMYASFLQTSIGKLIHTGVQSSIMMLPFEMNHRIMEKMKRCFMIFPCFRSRYLLDFVYQKEKQYKYIRS